MVFLSSYTSLRCGETDVSEENELNSIVYKFWDTETIGVREVEDSVYDELQNTIKYNDEKKFYEVMLPWKPSHGYLPDNYSNALRRLKSQLQRLKAKPDLLQSYHETIQEQLRENFVEKCDNQGENRIHYLPHRAVLREDRESTKLRIVMDASSKLERGMCSLNDCLFKGPSLTPLLFDVILRFRVNPVAFICDIRKAFLQIRVSMADRDALRFLWVVDPFVNDPQLVTLRFAVVLFGLNCSPFLLNGTLRHHFTNMDENPELTCKIFKILQC